MLNRYFFFALTLVTGVLLGAWLWTVDLSLNSFPDWHPIILVTFLTLTAYFLGRNQYRSTKELKKAETQSVNEENAGLHTQRAALLRLATSKVLYGGDIDSAIKELTEIAAFTLNTERVGVWLFDTSMQKIVCACLFEKSLQRHSSGHELAAEKAPRYFNAIRTHRVIVADDVLSNPLTNEFTYLSELGITSMIDAPIYVNGVLYGIVCHEHCGTKRHWTVDEQNFAGSIADMLAMAFEVTERRKVEVELKRKSRAIEASMEGIALIERDEKLSYLNQAFARVFGYSDPAELFGRSWKSLYDAHQLRKLERHVFISFRRAGNLQCEAIGTRKDGSTFAQELSLTALGDGGLVCIVRDITQRKEAEQHILENRRFLRRVIDTDPNFIFVKDVQGRFTLVNQAVADAYGTRPDDLIGKTDADFNSNPEEVEHFKLDDQAVINSGQELKIAEEVITDVQGQLRILQTVKRPLRMGKSQEVHVLGVSTDITEQKHLQAQLLQSQKMEALGQLAGGIAHDFNNMMTGILGYTTLLKLECSGHPQVLRSADMIENAATRAAELTQKLLGFARKGKHQEIPVDLHATIKETLAIIGRTIEKNISVTTDLHSENPFVLGDPVQIQQIILNLAINARDAMLSNSGGTNGGELHISTTLISKPLKNKTGTETEFVADEYLQISVRDTGCGIDESIQKRIFEPFFTTKAEGRGSGMGLAMVYGIVSNHDGVIEIESKPGQGSTFTILLPSTPRPTSVDSKVEKIHISTTPKCQTILVIDDHDVVREATSAMLISLGYLVVTAVDGVDGYDLFLKHQDSISLVIIDMVMPRMGAKECMRSIRQCKPDIPVILSTGYVKSTSVQEILQEGSVWFLQKPYQIESLARVVTEALSIVPPPVVEQESHTVPFVQ